jgi:autotransporter-associated beta strand protein
MHERMNIMKASKIRVLVLASAVAAVHSAAMADTVTLAPSDGVTTNVLSLFTGDTAVEVAGPGAVKLNPSNMHTGGTTLSGGTLILTGDIPAGGPSPVGTGTFTVSGGTLRGTGSFGGNITGTGAFTIEAQDGWALSGRNSFAEHNAFTIFGNDWV